MRNVIAAVLLVFASLNVAQAAPDASSTTIAPNAASAPSAPSAAPVADTLLSTSGFVTAFTKDCAEDMRTNKSFANFTANGKKHFCDCTKSRLTTVAEQQPQLSQAELSRIVGAVAMECTEVPVREMASAQCRQEIAPYIRKQNKANETQVTAFCACFSGKAWEASRATAAGEANVDSPEVVVKACLLRVGLKP